MVRLWTGLVVVWRSHGHFVNKSGCGRVKSGRGQFVDRSSYGWTGRAVVG